MKLRLLNAVLLLTLDALLVHGQVLQGAAECADARGFSICQNLASAPNGSNFQVSTGHRSTAVSISWSTEYNWGNSNPSTAKSFAHVQSKVATEIQLNTLPVLTSAWTWNYDSRSASSKAAVRLEMLIGSTKTPSSSAKAFNIQIWLSGDAGGVKPPGTKTAEAYCVSGHDWSIYRKTTGGVQTISFIELSGAEIKFFDGDLGEFVVFLNDFLKVPKTYYIQSIKAGTEVFAGSAKLYTSLYSLWAEFPGEDEILVEPSVADLAMADETLFAWHSEPASPDVQFN